MVLLSGFVVVQNVISHEVLDSLAVWCDLHAAQQVAAKLAKDSVGDGGGSFAGGFPRTAPYVREEVVANPLIEQLVAAILGPGAFMSFCK